MLVTQVLGHTKSALLWTALGRDAYPWYLPEVVQSLAGPIECVGWADSLRRGLGGTGILNGTCHRREYVMCVGCLAVSFRIIVYSKSRRLLLRETG